jgi:hypothetical protein
LSATHLAPSTVIIVHAAAEDAVTVTTFFAAVGAVVLLVGLAGAVLLVGPVLRRAWRQRRRSGDGDEGPLAPMQERTNQYRWYEDAAAVANDLEARGDDTQRQDHEGLLHVPQVTQTAPMAADPFADPFALDPIPPSAASRPSMLLNASLTSALLSGTLTGAGGAPRAAAALDAEPQRVNPLLQSHAI